MKCDKVYDQLIQPLAPGDYVVFRDSVGVIVDLNPNRPLGVFINYFRPLQINNPWWDGSWVKNENVIRISESSLPENCAHLLRDRYRTRRSQLSDPKWKSPEGQE